MVQANLATNTQAIKSAPVLAIHTPLVSMKCVLVQPKQLSNEILADIEEVADKALGVGNAANRILANIKCTMSDRASTEKSFNDLLTAYRPEILPTVVDKWGELLLEQREAMSCMYNFFVECTSLWAWQTTLQRLFGSLKSLTRNQKLPLLVHVQNLLNQAALGSLELPAKHLRNEGIKNLGAPYSFHHS